MSFFKILPLLRTIPRRFQSSLPPSRACWGRRDAFSELSSALQTMDRRMRDVDREMYRLLENMERSSPLTVPRILAPWKWGRFRDIPVEVSSQDGRKYQLELELPDMRPEDITVTLKDHTLKISARRDEKKPDGSRYLREYSHEYSLPSEVNPESVRSHFSDGVLTIEAALPALEESTEPTEIPVKVDSGDKKENPST